jgi:flavin-dependent dehydrogenase
MMERYDVIVIGGGPSGSTAAMVLARRGRRVLVVEKERFPRFHIGESLLPYNLRLFRELDLLDVIEKAGFVRKLGAQFWIGNGSRHIDVRFADGEFNEETCAFQVERSVFDELLLRHAASAGVEVREDCAVNGYSIGHDGVRVQTTAGVFEADFLVDASGQVNFTGNRDGVRQSYPSHRKVAVFGHFAGVPVPEGDRRGDIVIVRLESEWAWLIPLAGGKMSVGLVLDQSRVKASPRGPEELFSETIAGSAVLVEKLAAADRIGPLRVIADYSYSNRRFIGPRLVRVGDAAAFLDPIFSSGVYLAMRSARDGAHAVDDALERRAEVTSGMRRYEKRLRRSMGLYWKLIEQFYTRPFIEVFLAPDPPRHLQSAVNSILAGRIESPWSVRWRIWMFYGLVRLRSFWAFTPPIDFARS